MAELCNAIDENQLGRFILLPKNSNEGLTIEGKIVSRKDDKIFVDIWQRGWAPCVDESDIYCMHFQPIRKNFHLQMAALESVDTHELFGILINNQEYHVLGKKLTTFNVDYQLPEGGEGKIQLSYYERGCHSFAPCTRMIYYPSKLFASLNDEQRTAVVNIVEGGHYPVPYLLYGPPGSNFFHCHLKYLRNLFQYLFQFRHW